MRTVFLALLTLLLSSGSALAAPFDNITTHNAAVPEQSFQIAATWFLPDWQASMSGRSESAPDKSGDRHDLTCSTYGGCAGVPANMTCSQSFRVDGTNCYKSCACKSGYNRVSSSDVCAGCVNPCDTVTAVSTPYGCQTAWAVCPSKCQVAYPDNCRNRNAVSTPYGCKTAFADCSSKCQTAYPDNCHNRTAVPTPYGCQSAFVDCSSKCQTAYPDNCHNRPDNKTDYGCDKYWEDCLSKCKTGKTCTATDCSAYKLTSIPANANYTSCTPGCGNSTTTYKIVSCKTDYTDDGKGGCRAKTCSEKDANTKTCGSTCIAKTACCGGCPTGQTCSNGNCIQLCTPPSSSQGWVPMSQTPSSPNVTLYPTGATGTGTNSCFLAEWMTKEETTDDGCNKQYHRYCLDLSPSNGWTKNSGMTSKTCLANQKKFDQSDGCDGSYTCCQKFSCTTLIPTYVTARSATQWMSRPNTGGDIAQYNKAQEECTSMNSYWGYPASKAILAQDNNCGTYYYSCMRVFTDVLTYKQFVSCDSARSLGYIVDGVYPQYVNNSFYLPCSNLDYTNPYPADRYISINGYVPTRTTITYVPSIPTGN